MVFRTCKIILVYNIFIGGPCVSIVFGIEFKIFSTFYLKLNSMGMEFQRHSTLLVNYFILRPFSFNLFSILRMQIMTSEWSALNTHIIYFANGNKRMTILYILICKCVKNRNILINIYNISAITKCIRDRQEMGSSSHPVLPVALPPINYDLWGFGSFASIPKFEHE